MEQTSGQTNLLSKPDCKELLGLMKENYVEGVFFTHVSLIKPKGKYNFSCRDMDTFFRLYSDAINSGAVLGIAEKPQNNLPILADIDIKIREDQYSDIYKDGLYRKDQLETVIQIYQSVLRKIIDNCEEQDLLCVVLEKKMYTKVQGDTQVFKNGFHLHFPYCFLSPAEQDVHLIPRVQEEMRNSKVFENLVEDSGSLIDNQVCHVNWLMYGSRKSEDNDPYLATKAYDANMNEISIQKALKQYQIFNYEKDLIDVRGKIHTYLPYIFSTSVNGREHLIKNIRRGIISPLKEKIKKEKKENEKTTVDVQRNLEIARKLLPLISEKRTENFTDWMTIGWVLYNISEGDHEGLELFLEFSSRCEDKFDEAECISKWDGMVVKDYSIGTLRHFAKIDSPEQYRKFKEEESMYHVEQSIEGSHNDVAKALYALYGDEFVCASIANHLWFQFIGHRWEQIEEGVFLREKISGEIIQRYQQYLKEFNKGFESDDNDKSSFRVLQERQKKITKVIGNLKCASYKNHVMKECEEVFYDKNFKNKLNTDAHKICFKNGVFDFKVNQFRGGRPEDYLSRSLPINYIQFNTDDERVQEVYDFLEKVFPDKSIRKYFMDINSNVFVGGNSEKIVQFWTGEGDNAKSITQELFEMMLGELAIKFPTTMVTGKKVGNGSANADLARAGNGVRWAVMEEPDGDEQINNGVFKTLSGGDTQYARDLFQKGSDVRELILLFKLIFICNKLPRFKNSDKATWNRVRVIPFESTFTNDCPDTIEEQNLQKRFPRDKRFKDKLPRLVEAFAWVLIEHRKTVKNIIEPEKVLSATASYRSQNDVYRQFCNELVIEDKSAQITALELYSQFKDWFKEGFPHHSVPTKNDMEEYFKVIWGNHDASKTWKGYRFKTLEDNQHEGEEINKEVVVGEVSEEDEVIIIE